MSTPAQRTHVDDVALGARRAQAAVASAVSTAGPVRLVIAGPRGSAKSAVLDGLVAAAELAARPVARLAYGQDPDAVDAAVVLLVDDLHTRDAVTLDALERRAADPTASLVAATRPWAAEVAVSRISTRLEAARPALVLGQVSRADVLAHHAGDALASVCVDWILQVTGGVAWLVAASLDAHDDRDCIDDPLHLELERLLSDVIAHRLATVDDDVRLAVEDSCAARDAGPATALRRAHAEGLLLRDGTPVPLVRSAVSAGPAAAGMTDRVRAAWAMGDLDAVARLVDLARSQGTGSPAVLAAVAGSTWSARGMLEVAHRLSASGGHSDVGGVIAAVGTGTIPVDVPVTAVDTTTTEGIAAALLRDGLRLSIAHTGHESAGAVLARASHLSTAAGTLPLPELPAVIAAAAAQSQGDLAAARRVIDAAIAGSQGGAAGAPRLLLWRAWLAMHQVRSREARESLAAATAVASGFTPRDEMLAHAVRLGLARRHGDAAVLAAAWDVARPALLAIDVDLYLVQPLTEFIASAAKLHDVESTDAATRRALDILDRLGAPALWTAPLRWAAVQRALLVNDPVSLAPHAHALALLAAHSPVASTMASAGRLWTAVRGGSVVVDDVESAAVALARLGLTWDAARLAGTAAGVSDDRRASARLLSRAREIHPPDAARTGIRPATESLVVVEPAAAPAGLSPREVDVARLVVEGKTYAEIGAAIFISPRTAEHHIASIRRRLGATSRSDLVARLRVALATAPAGIRAVA